MSSSMLTFRQLSTPPFTATCILIGQVAKEATRKVSQRCQKLSQTNQTLCPSGDGTRRSTMKSKLKEKNFTSWTA